MGKDEKPDIQNVMSAKEYADYLKRSAAFRRGIQETYAPGLKNYTRKDLLDDYKSLSMTPKDRMLAIPAETKRKWAQKRVTNNLALEKYFKDNNFSASDIKLFKKSDIRNHLRKIRNRENHFQKLANMSTTELNAYFLKRARMSKVRNTEKRRWEIDFLADLTPELRYKFYQQMHKSPRYIQALQNQHGDDNRIIADYPISQMELYYNGKLDTRPYYHKEKKLKEKYTKDDPMNVYNTLINQEDYALDGDIPDNIEQIMRARKLAYEERQRQWQAARAVKHDTYLGAAKNQLDYEDYYNNLNPEERAKLDQAQLKLIPIKR